jgi:hypothetical protein
VKEDCGLEFKLDLCPTKVKGGVTREVNYRATAGMFKVGKGHAALNFYTTSAGLGSTSERQWYNCVNILTGVDAELKERGW